MEVLRFLNALEALQFEDEPHRDEQQGEPQERLEALGTRVGLIHVNPLVDGLHDEDHRNEESEDLVGEPIWENDRIHV